MCMVPLVVNGQFGAYSKLPNLQAFLQYKRLYLHWSEQTAGKQQNKGDHKMAYKKPEIVAKSESKQSFVAGCPAGTYLNPHCSILNQRCMQGRLS